MGPGSGGGRRGGRPQPYPSNAHHYQHNVTQPMYPPAYIAPYGGAPYYMPSHYQSGAMGAPAYLPYPPAGYNRSPPSMQHYAPMVAQSHYSRPPQSPIIPSPYQAPPPPSHIPLPPQTPSSTVSHTLPPSATPPVTQVKEAPLVQTEAPSQEQPLQEQPVSEQPVPEQPVGSKQPPPVEPEVSPDVEAIRAEPFRPKVSRELYSGLLLRVQLTNLCFSFPGTRFLMNLSLRGRRDPDDVAGPWTTALL